VSPRRRVLIGVAVLASVQAAAIAGYLVIQRERNQEASSQLAGFAAEELAPRLAPALTGERRDGSQVSLAELRGKYVLVHFWATWCPPCLRELPGLLATAAELRKAGRLELLAVSVDDEWEELAAFFDGTIPEAVVRPSEGAMPARFGASDLPDTYLVDPEGRVIGRYLGARDWTSAAVRKQLDEAMGSRGNGRGERSGRDAE
jgi:thiol-disulfide isomerase/thioredoxin